MDIFYNENMTSLDVPNQMFISKLTLSFFEDSGWYIPIYENGNDLVWGKNKGCDFIE